MSSVYKSLKTSDVNVISYKAARSVVLPDCFLLTEQIKTHPGKNVIPTVTGSLPSGALYYRSVRQLYYADNTTSTTPQLPISQQSYQQLLDTENANLYTYPQQIYNTFRQSTAASGTFESENRYTFPTQSDAEIRIISIPTTVIGAGIQPGSFVVYSDDPVNYFNFYDDGNGNIFDATNNDAFAGNIIYAHGIIVITNPLYFQIFPTYPITTNDTANFTVNTFPKVISPLSNDISGSCRFDTGSIVLSGSNSSFYTVNGNGTITLNGVANGDYSVYYTVNSLCGSGCIYPSNQSFISVSNNCRNLIVSFSALQSNYIITGSAVELTGSQTGTGSFTGSGTTNIAAGYGTWLPATAGVGSHPITYTYVDQYSCSYTSTQTVVVSCAITPVSFNPLPTTYFANSASILLSGSQAPSGSFTGSGIVNYTGGFAGWTASLAGAGTHILTYTYTDSYGCSNVATQSIQVLCPNLKVSIRPTIPATYNLNGAPFTISGSMYPSGTFTGTGFVDNGDGTATLTPSLLTSGSYNVTYSYSEYGCLYQDSGSLNLVGIGQSYQGGLVAYFDGSDRNGFVVSTVDLADGLASDPQVGDSFGGGKIGYIFQPGDVGYAPGTASGLILNNEDVLYYTIRGTNYYTGLYGDPGYVINATGSNIGSGSVNTAIMVASYPFILDSAGIVVNTYTSGGYSDWYLPSSREMVVIGANSGALGLTTSHSYWTSTEVDANNAMIYRLTTGNTSSVSKATSSYARAVRNFNIPLMPWGSVGVTTNATSPAIYDGDANTTLIVAAEGVGTYAARLAYDYATAGYSDWYLPSQNELDQIYINRVALGITDPGYWSSTETSANQAVAKNFTAGTTSSIDKDKGRSVRAIRYF